MAFDEDFAKRFAVQRDRDSAGEFFAGRKAEIESFETALDFAARNPRMPAEFRVYQGAPGAGKTALLARIEERHRGDATFVPLENEHLASRADLLEELAVAAASRVHPGIKAAAVVAQGIVETVRARNAAEALREWMGKGRTERLVVALDEAQTVDQSCAPGLRSLHRRGIGIPTTVALFGLSHTADRLRSLDGLSRLSRQAVVEVGTMAEEECAESTAKLLAKIDPLGDRERAAKFVAKSALRWPQHLKCAQSALCDELVRVRGDLDRMDFGRIRDETDAARFAYYRGRLAGSDLDEDPAFTAAIVRDVRRAGRTTFPRLAGTCAKRLAAKRRDEPEFPSVSGREFARLLVEKGVLSRTPDGGFEPTIPSMADWFEATWPERPPPDRRRGLGR